MSHVDKAAESCTTALGFRLDRGNDDAGIGDFAERLTHGSHERAVPVHRPESPVIVWLNVNSKQEVDELFERWQGAGVNWELIEQHRR